MFFFQIHLLIHALVIHVVEIKPVLELGQVRILDVFVLKGLH